MRYKSVRMVPPSSPGERLQVPTSRWLANQRPFATATADQHGDWVAVTEKRIGSGDHQFSLTARLGRDGPPIYGQIVGRSVASPRSTRRCQ